METYMIGEIDDICDGFMYNDDREKFIMFLRIYNIIC